MTISCIIDSKSLQKQHDPPSFTILKPIAFRAKQSQEFTPSQYIQTESTLHVESTKALQNFRKSLVEATNSQHNNLTKIDVPNDKKEVNELAPEPLLTANNKARTHELIKYSTSAFAKVQKMSPSE